MRWLDQLLAPGEGTPQTQVRAYYLRGWLSLLQGDAAAALPWVNRAVATARQTGQLQQLSESLSMAAIAESVAGDLESAGRHLDETAALTPGLNDFSATIELMQARAVHAFFRWDVETALSMSSEGVRFAREAGDLYQLEAMLRNLGMIGMMTGDIQTARARFADALRVARQVDNRFAQFYGLAALGWHAARSGQPRLAARLLGAAETVGTRAGADIMGPSVPFLAQAKESAIGALGESKFEAEFIGGGNMSREAAVRLALGEPEHADVERQPSEAGPLAKRQVEVARLVADGLSNKQIAARLFISEATVASHIRGILNKLGFNSRAQIAGWITSSHP